MEIYVALRGLVSSGVVAWLDDITTIIFDRDHPRLSRHKAPVPEHMLKRALRQIDRIVNVLSRLALDPELAARSSAGIRSNLSGAGGFTAAGLAMTMLIEKRLGEERLRGAGGEVAAFFQAYQEAAELNPPESTAREGSIDWYLEQLPAFSSEAFPALLKMIREQVALLPVEDRG